MGDGWWGEDCCRGGALPGFARFFGYLDGYGRLDRLKVSRPWLRCLVWRMGWVAGVAGWLGLLASFFVGLLFQIQETFKEVRGASRSDFADPGGPPRPESQAVPGEGFSRAVMARGCTAQ